MYTSVVFVYIITIFVLVVCCIVFDY